MSALPAPLPASTRPLAAWLGTLTRPGSGIGFWAAAFAGHPGMAALAVAGLALAAALRGA